MANKRIKDLPAATDTLTGDIVAIDGATTRGITVENFLKENLVAIKGLTSAADKGIQFTGSGTAATYDLTAAGKALLDDADAAAQRTTMGVVIGTNVQAYDAGLQSISGLTTAADKMIYTTASDTYAVTTLTSFARTILDDADQSTAQATLGLGIGTDVQAYSSNLDAFALKTAPTGDVVGTSDVQTLIGKTISGASNTLTVREADLSLSDNTTGNVSIAQHGFVPKLPNNATQYLDGTGAFSVPAVGGGQFISILDYGAVDDVKSGSDGIMGTGSTTFSSATATFTSGDIGKRIVVQSAGTGGTRPLETTIASITNSTTIVLSAANAAGISVSGARYYYGTDSTVAIQAAITAAQATGTTCYIPAGTYLLSATLDITGHIKLTGDGHAGDQGMIYNTQKITKASGWKASILIGSYTQNGIHVATNDAVTIEDFGIIYPLDAATNVIGMFCDSGGSSNDANVYSVIRNVLVAQSDYGLYFANWYDFTVDSVRVANVSNTSVQISPTNFPNYGDWTITNSHFMSGSAGYHVALTSGGGGRICNNKMNYGATGSSVAIIVAPSLNTGAQIEPLLITNNSIEGQAKGIQIARQAGDTQIHQLVISGNQIWTGGTCFEHDIDATNTEYTQGVTFVGNHCVSEDSGTNILSLNGVQNMVIDGNTFLSSAGSANAIAQGATVANIILGTNCKGTGVT